MDDEPFEGPAFFDDEEIFQRYQHGRASPLSANDTLEKPVIDELVGDVSGLDILDLGCGNGEYGVELMQAGCAAYTGVEASQKMFDLGEKLLAGTPGTIFHTSIEKWDYQPECYDLVVSRLALHYVDDLDAVFRAICRSLRPNGRFIFSVEHPVLTSSNKSALAGGRRGEWIVDNYFVTGRRDVLWMGKRVVKYHRTIEDYFNLLCTTGFRIHHLRESDPDPAYIEDLTLLQRRKRIPLMLFFSARKPPNNFY